jgi:hypothetical protein
MTDATAPSPPPTSVWQREEINAQIRNEAPATPSCAPALPTVPSTSSLVH